jgi:uncharacterized membrane protein
MEDKGRLKFKDGKILRKTLLIYSLIFFLQILLIYSEDKSYRPVTIKDDGWVYWEKNKPDIRYKHKLFTIDTGGQPYAISLNIKQQKQSDGTWKTIDSDIGMPKPSEANWYHSGFFKISHNIQKVEPEVEIVETGKQGIIDFIWKNLGIVVRARFIAEQKSDRILLELRWEKNIELKNFGISFTCYPQSFRVAESSRLKGEKLERHMITAERDVQKVQTVKLNLPYEYWQLYMDKTIEKTPFYPIDGPCALAFLPDDVEEATVAVTDYPITISIVLKESNGRARFVLWDFTGKTADESKKILIEEAPALLDYMRTGKWLPGQITDFDITAKREYIDNLEINKEKKETIEKKLAFLQEKYEDLKNGKYSIQLEREFREEFKEYQILLWQAERPYKKDIRILFLSGLFGYAWKVEKIVKSSFGNESIKLAGHTYTYWGRPPHILSYFPSTKEELLSYDAIILADIPQDPLTPEMKQNITGFVELGGGLLILGGPYAYGGGNWKDSPIHKLLPVVIGKPFDLKPSGNIDKVKLTEKGIKYLGNIDKLLGVVPWRNTLEVKQEAEIWATAGDKPFAVVSKAGEGRVMAILAGAVGEAPEGEIPFWDSPGWDEFLMKCLLYLARGE